MAEQKKEGSFFNFGAASSSGSTPSIFGTSSGNTFGGGADKPAGNLFGSAATSSSGAGQLLFSQPAGGSSQSAAPSIFSTTTSQAAPFGSFGGTAGGNTPSSTGGTFSTPDKPASSGAEQASKPGTFGAGSGGGLFGSSTGTAPTTAAPSATPPAQNKPSGLFGSNPSTTPAGPPPSSGANTSSFFGDLSKPQEKKSLLFGSVGQPSSTTSTPPTQASQAPGSSGIAAQSNPTGLFGSSTFTGSSNPASGAQTGASFFGGQPSTQSAQAQASKPKASNLFDVMTSNKPASSPTFGGQGPSAATSSAPGGQLTTSTVFGSAASTQNDASSTASSQPSTNPSFGATAPSGQTAPASNAPATAAPTSNLFGSSATPASTSGGATSFFPQAASSPPASAGGASATPAPASNLFGNLGAKPASNPPAPTPAASSNPFASLGSAAQPATSQAQSSKAATPSGTAATAAPAPLFGGHPTASSGAPQPSTQAPAGARTDDVAKGTSLGASTSGPKPTPQSRLKNKSMDEIITRWASDLNKYQKEFQTQAATVAKWDRMLVENSDKIQKLYGHTLEAERATIEVERQLTAVENDQAELEYWLEHYEHQVDELMSKQVGQSDSLSGPDQERERTYKLAERLSDRLDEMSKDLTAMVDEINDASSNLSKTSKPDDPLSQIVRVLNGHLSQLQQIDQGTAALQAKVQAAQRASRQIGGPGRNGLGSEGADDFYRSFMGRR